MAIYLLALKSENTQDFTSNGNG
ncbi:uncharacterized protein G2W53_008691 [Senna tora]|uniref:Uncharacterized protein n=1 Tax=Senna tora TaxID=362788 RepID=A0A835CFG0_9FABA|nr:uncharacterized protein G2W53_008691 [Senna tora]